MKTIWLAFFVLFSVLTLGCGKSSTGIRGKVISTAGNAQFPGQVIVTQEGGGATESRAYRVYLVNTETGSTKMLLLADKTAGVSAAWTPSGIELSMHCGRIFEYTNFADVLDANGNLKARVDVELAGAHMCSQ